MHFLPFPNSLLTLLTLLTILLTTTYNIYNYLQYLRNWDITLKSLHTLLLQTLQILQILFLDNFFFLPFQQHFFFNKYINFITYKSLTRITFHLFLKLATVPFVFAIYFSVSHLIFTFIKIRENASFSSFPNTQFSENYKIIYGISSI